MTLFKKAVAECFGTMTLVLFGCGVAIATGAETVATSLAFGLSIVAMAYSIGNVSGCHVNPAVSLAMLINKKISFKEFLTYVAAQLVGATVACLLLMMAFGKDCGFGANTIQTTKAAFTDSSAVNSIIALVSEIVLTCVFVYAILGVTSKEKYSGVAGLVIGGTLTLVHLLGLFLTGTSVNPARSLIPALFALCSGTAAISQVWIFIVGPLVGAALAALLFMFLEGKKKEEKTAEKEDKKVENA